MNSSKLTKWAANTAICSIVAILFYSVTKMFGLNLEFLIGWLTCMLYVDLKNEVFKY